jgi:hypothetical protein
MKLARSPVIKPQSFQADSFSEWLDEEVIM